MGSLNTKLWGTWEFLGTLCAIAADCKYPPSSLPAKCFCWGSPQPPQDAPVSLLAVDIFSNLSTKLFIFAFQDILRVSIGNPPPTEWNQIAILWQYPTKSCTKHIHARYSVSYLFVILQWKWNARKWGNKGSAFQPLQHHVLFGVNILSSSLMYYINIFVKVWCRNISSFIPNKLRAICRWGTPVPVTAAVIATAAATTYSYSYFCYCYCYCYTYFCYCFCNCYCY